MPVFMDDPSILTKERLKSELLANNVELPGGNPPRDVYVQLYVKTLSAQSHGTDTALDAFSSDEELPPPVVSRKSRSSGRKSAAAQLETLDVTLLTDEALRDQLLLHGLHPGPIVSSTRKLYEKKLQKLQDKGASPSESQKNHNSGDAGLYSDQEEELIAGPGPTPAPDPSPDPEPDPEPVHEQEVTGRSRRNNTSQRRSTSQHSATKKVQQVEIVEEAEKMRTAPPPEKEAAVPELIVTGLTASCRRPIKGAAARPVKPDDLRQSAHIEMKVSNSAFSSVSSAPFASNGSDPALLYTAAPPASTPVPEANTSTTRQAKARAGMSWGKKLLLWAVLAGFLFLVYQAMETNSAAPFEENPEL